MNVAKEDDSERVLLSHIAEEFGNRGIRTVDFLLTAAVLLRGDSSAPRIAEAACYCTREALKEIPQSAPTPQTQPWRHASKAVVDARQRYEIAMSLPGSDPSAEFRRLMQAIDDLEVVHSQERIHHERLLAVMVARAGTQPIPPGPIKAYQRLVDRLDRLLHSTTTIECAALAYQEALDLLSQLFMPPELRLPGLAALAELPSPTDHDVARLTTLIASPRHLEYFFGKAVSAEWLGLLDCSDLLAPPKGQGNWPVFKFVDRLKDRAPSVLVDWLARAYRHWASESAMSAWYIARAALNIGTEGRPIVLAALRSYPSTPYISNLALSLVENIAPQDHLIVELADQGINPSSSLDNGYGLKVMVKAVDAGVTSDNWRERVDLLVHKLRSVDSEGNGLSMINYERAGSIADPVEFYDDDRPIILLHGLVDVLRSSHIAGVSVTDLLDAVGTLKEELRQRVRAWLLSEFDEVPVGMLLDEIADAIANRDPCGDDLPLVDRVTEAVQEDCVEKWRGALGTPPSPEEVGKALAEGSTQDSWFRVRLWSAVLPSATTDAWSKANAVLTGAFGPTTRESLTTRRQIEIGQGTSPLTQEELAQMPIEEAARWIAHWRPDPTAWLVGARELARTLEAVVKESPGSWAAFPLKIVSLLHEPVYVSHYLRGLANAESLPFSRAEDIVEAVAFARTHPWPPAQLGRNAFDYDPTWGNADDDGLALLRRLADVDRGFDGRTEQVWGIVLDAAGKNDEPSTYDDPLGAAINRSQTRAVETMFSFMGWEYRMAEIVRPQALALLDTALRRVGRDGEQHRAIIAPRLPFLLFVAPEWVQERAGLLFGDVAPEGLAQVTVDLFVQWGRPNHWIYIQARSLLLDAVRRNVTHALSFWLVAMLGRLDGYGVGETINLLAGMGDERLSTAGETLGRLLRGDDVNPAHLAVAIEFFESVLSLRQPGALHGFGWFADVRTLDEHVWMKLTAQAARLSGGRLDWAHRVAERAAGSPSREGLEIFNELVRGLPDDWDRGDVMAQALGLLRRAGQPLRDTEAFRRLRTSLLERGSFDAADV